MSKVVRTRKDGKSCCPRCHHAGYSQSVAPDGRPLFTCGGCGKKWTSGMDGGIYVRREGAKQ